MTQNTPRTIADPLSGNDMLDSDTEGGRDYLQPVCWCAIAMT